MAKPIHPGKGNKLNHPIRAERSKQISRSVDSFAMLSTRGAEVILGISVLVFLIARIRLLAIPLERDEGSFAYIGHWIWRGKELYTEMLDSKLPGLYTVYAFFTSLFGYNATGVHIGLLLLNVVSAICLFLLVQDLFNRFVACLGTAIFLFLVISPNTTGFAAHATQLLTPFVLGSFLLFFKGISTDRKIFFFLSGLLMGIAFTIKQQSVVYGLLLAILWWPARSLWSKKSTSSFPVLEWIWLGIGGMLPLLTIVSYFFLVGRFGDLYSSTFVQPMQLANSFQESKITLFLNILPVVTMKTEGIWILAILGMVTIFISGYHRQSAMFVFLMAIIGFMSVAIGAAYYPHYFVIALPGIAVLAACALHWISMRPWLKGPLPALVMTGILLFIQVKGRADYYFHPDYAKIHFEAYNQNMFPELEKIGQELGKRVKEGDRIGILGSEPEVLVAADRESCSRHLMVYSMFIDPVLSPVYQEEYIREIKACMPEFLVWNTGSASWTKGYEEMDFFIRILDWAKANYIGIGLAESRGEMPGLILWDEAARAHQFQSGYRIYVLRKKENVDPLPQ